MRKVLFIFVPILFIFSACKYNPPCYSIAVSIDTDNENTFFIETLKSSYISSKVNTVITGKYIWLPFTPKDSSINKIISTNENIISITSVDFDKRTFTALTKQTGKANIKVIMNDNNFSSSLEIIVIN